MVDTQINVALRIICAAVDSTPILWLYVMIAPSHIKRQEAALKEYQKIENNNELPIFDDIENIECSSAKVYKPFL